MVQIEYGELAVNLSQGRYHYTTKHNLLPDVTVQPLARNKRDDLVLIGKWRMAAG